MRYMLLIYTRESDWTSLSDQGRGELFGEYMAFTEQIRKSGHYVAGDGLEATSTATTVRVRNGQTVSTDGPFAETREQLGGFYLVDVSDLDEAIGIAARIPPARKGTIEIRPVLEIPNLPTA